MHLAHSLYTVLHLCVLECLGQDGTRAVASGRMVTYKRCASTSECHQEQQEHPALEPHEVVLHHELQIIQRRVSMALTHSVSCGSAPPTVG